MLEARARAKRRTNFLQPVMMNKGMAYGFLRVSMETVLTRFCHLPISPTTVLLRRLSHHQYHTPTTPHSILLLVPTQNRYLGYSTSSVYPLLNSVSSPAPDLLNLHPALQPNKTVLHPQARTRTRMIVMIMAMISQTLYVEHPSRSTPIDPTGTDRPSYLTCLPSPNHFGPHLPTSPYRLLNHHVLAVVNLPLSCACDPLNLLQSKLGITTVSQTDFHHSSPSLRRLLTCPLSQARQVLVLALALVLDVYHKVNQGGHWNRLDHIGQRLRKARRQLREEVRVSTRARPRARAVANRGKRWSLSRG